jgi:hypothetical protein
MGGFATGFLKTIGDKAQKKVEENSANEQALKSQQAKVYWDAIQSGRLSPDQIKYAQDQLQKLYPKSKGIKDIFSKIGQAVGIVHPPQGAGDSKGATVAPPPGANGGTPPFVAAGANKSNPVLSAVESKPESTPKSGESSAEPVKPVAPPPSFSSIVSAAYPNPDEVEKKKQDTAFQQKQKEMELAHNYKMEEQKEAAKAKAANPTGRASAISPISMTAARKMAEKGMVFNGADGGQPLILDDYDDTMMLVPLQQNGHIIGYSPASQHQTHMTFNNQVVAVPALNQMDANVSGVVQGQAKTGSTSSRETIAVDASGNPIKQTLTSTSTPNTPQKNSGAGKVSPPPAVTIPKSQGGKGKAESETKKAVMDVNGPQAKSGGPKPAYMTPGMYKAGIERVTPIREAATQVLGDPTQPAMKSLKDYAYVADDPEARDRVGKAIRLTFDGLEDGHVPHSQIMQLVSMKMGLPQMLAGAKAEQLQQAIGGLKPDEQKLYNKVMSAYGAIIGLRSLTKAGSSNFSMQKIEQEAPIPGLNATNAAQMYDQLANLAEIIYNGTRTLPDTIMPKEEKEYFKNQVGELLALSNGGKKGAGKVSPPPGAKGKQPKTADEYLSGVGK